MSLLSEQGKSEIAMFVFLLQPQILSTEDVPYATFPEVETNFKLE
jgi:hypothetical protein